MGTFNKPKLIELQSKLKSKEIKPSTEEATKQWLIMPFIVALGYDPYSSDVIPEYTLDVGVKRGEKVDYALQVNGQPVALIECKQLSTNLSEKHISQLFRYFTTSDVHVAILTNGDDYWFFTDSKKENVMDLEPYMTIKLSEATDDDLDKLEQYSKDMIQYIDVASTVQYERFQTECRELAQGLRTNNIPGWLIDILADRSGLFEIERPTLADYLYTEIQKEFNGFKVDKKVKKLDDNKKSPTSLGQKMKDTMNKNKENKSNIKINHEYVYNDYSDGNWTFHILDYAIILGVKYEEVTARSLLLNTIIELLKQGKVNREEILLDEQFNKGTVINTLGGFRGAHYIEEYDLYIATSFGIDGIIKFIQKLLNHAELPDNSVIISFKA